MATTQSAFTGLIGILLFAGSAACSDGEPAQPNVSIVEHELAAVEAVGTNSSKFFPIGIYYEGVKGILPDYTGGVPKEPVDSSVYHEETLRQLKALGLNTIVHVNSDDDHADSMFAAAEKVGGIHFIHAAHYLANTYLAADYQDAVYCETPSGPWPASGDTPVCHPGILKSTQCTVHRFSDQPLLLAYQIRDEPPPNMLPAIRAVGKYINFLEQAPAPPCAEQVIEPPPPDTIITQLHPWSGSIATWGGIGPLGTTPNGMEYGVDFFSDADKMLRGDYIVGGEAYPLKSQWDTLQATPIGDTVTLENWGDYITSQYNQLPADKPLYAVIQAHRWHMIPTFAGEVIWGQGGPRHPDPRELRYMTYAALARGAKGVFWFYYQTNRDTQGVEQRRGIADTDLNLNWNGKEIGKIASELRQLAPWLADARRDDQAGGPSIGTISPSDATLFDMVPFRTTSNEELIMVVNQQLNDPGGDQFTVTLNPLHPGVQAAFARGAVQIVDLRNEIVMATCTQASSCSFSAVTSAGDGRLYHLRSALAADIRISRGDYSNPVTSWTGFTATLEISNRGTTTWMSGTHKLGVKLKKPDGSTDYVLGYSINDPVPSQDRKRVTLTVDPIYFNQTGIYDVSFDMYTPLTGGQPDVWFHNPTSISVMVAPDPLFVDTFDVPPFNRPVDAFYRWERDPVTQAGAPTALREGALSMNGSESPKTAMTSRTKWGDNWSSYTLELDVYIDEENPDGAASAGWVVGATGVQEGVWFRLRAATNKITTHRLSSNGSSFNVTPLVEFPTGLTSVTKGTWYRIKQVVTPTQVQTWIKRRSSSSAPTLVGTLTTTVGPGRVGLRLHEDPVFLADETQRAANTERAHFDNLFVYGTTPNQSTPAQITGVVATPTTVGTTAAVRVTWTGDTSANGARISYYQLYRGPTSGFGASSPVGITTNASFVDAAVSTGSTYYYFVRAVSHMNQQSAPSTGASTTVPLPPQASNVGATIVDMRTVELTWTGNAPKYRIHRGAPGFTPSESNRIATVSGGTFYRDHVANIHVSDSQVGLRSFRQYTYSVIPEASSGQTGTPATITTSTLPGSRLFSETFASDNGTWLRTGGTWTLGSGVLTQWSTAASIATATLNPMSPKQQKWGDLVAEFTMEIKNVGATDYWAGMTIRKSSVYDALATGFVIYYRANGFLELLQTGAGPGAGVIAAVDTRMTPYLDKRRVRVEASGRRIRVLVDGTIFIDWDNPNGAGWIAPGYVDLVTYGVKTEFRDVNIFFRDGFNRIQAAVSPTVENWSLYAGSFDPGTADEFGQLGLKPPLNTLWLAAPKELKVGDFTAELMMRVQKATDPTMWGAFSFRRTVVSHSVFESGYTLYLRDNGQLTLMRPGASVNASTIAMCPLPLAPRDCYHHIRVVVSGNNIRVWLDGATNPTINWTDPSPASVSNPGFVSVSAYGADTRFEALNIY